MQLTCTTTFTKQLTRCCLEMSENEIMLFRKWVTAWLQITRTLKKILAEETYNFSCCNIHCKRHNKNHLPASWQFPSASVNRQLKSSRRKLAAKVVKTTELINLFDRSTNQPLFSAVLFSTDTLISLVHHLFNHVTFLHGYTAKLGGAKFDLQSSVIFFVGYFASFRNSIASPL